MSRLIIMCGLPGSGKSTVVENIIEATPGLQCVCPDDIRLGMGTKFCRELEPHVHAIAKTMLRAHMKRGLPIILDECNTVTALVKPYVLMARDMGYDVCLAVVTTDPETCVQRRLDKEPQYPWRDIITSKAKQLEECLDAIVEMVGKDKTVIVSGEDPYATPQFPQSSYALEG